MMHVRAGRRRWRNQMILPLRYSEQISNTISCWYCDFKFLVLNEPLFHFGRKCSRFLRVWFSIGIGFTLAAVLGMTLILLFEFSRLLLVYMGNSRFVSPSLFGLSSMFTGSNISLPTVMYLCTSSVISVIVHESGHALAAASEGVHIEYVAVFLAVLFPGALVAFNHASLQALPLVASLRVYCAGIWHNAAFCAVCTVALLLLPYILNPFHAYGGSPMVLNVTPTSPLAGYLSHGDVIISLDGIQISTMEEWKHKIAFLIEQTKSFSSDRINGMKNGTNGYCVPHYLVQEAVHTNFKSNAANCPDKLNAFIPASCLDSSKYKEAGPIMDHHNRGESVLCLDAKDVIKLKKCYNTVEYPRNRSGCVCSEVESCLMPLQLPGLGWIEFTFSSLDCLKHGRNSGIKNSISRENCLQTFVFVGDLISMVHSIHLTNYQPRFSVKLTAYLPNILEKLFTCLFHVSMLLALLNSLPVFFLDGESIIEAIIHHYVPLNVRKRLLILVCCLLGGTFVAVSLFLQMVFSVGLH